jgi:hypothetical protein
MPESVRDRPTKAHEYIFLLSKSQKYYFDAEAVREQSEWSSIPSKRYQSHDPNGSERPGGNRKLEQPNPSGRNLRTVWTVSTQPFSGAHFATFPEEIPERCIKAGTSEKGCCPKCGKAWVRVVEKQRTGRGKTASELEDGIHNRSSAKSLAEKRQAYRAMGMEGPPSSQTLGWQPSCLCDQFPYPCVVLDPFMGSGTVAKVAIRLRRQWVGIDINPAYGELADKRKAWTQVEMIDA